MNLYQSIDGFIQGGLFGSEHREPPVKLPRSIE